jgi:ATP-dependent Clp protease adapter protein ClpS
VKTAGTSDLSSCKDKKGKEKTDCEKPIKEKAKTDTKAAKDKAKEAKMALDCCKNPKKKGCTP